METLTRIFQKSPAQELLLAGALIYVGLQAYNTVLEIKIKHQSIRDWHKGKVPQKAQ